MPNTRTIPQELKDLNKWITWRNGDWNEKKGKYEKIPNCSFKPEGSRREDPFFDEYNPFNSVVFSEKIGFVLTKSDNIYGLDLDFEKGMDKDEFEAKAREIIAKFSSFTEVSVNGEGYHIFFRAPFIDLTNRNKAFPENINIEVYNDKRYFTVSGNHVAGTPLEVVENKKALDWLLETYYPQKPETIFTPQEITIVATKSDFEIISEIQGSSSAAKFEELMNGTVEITAETDFSILDGRLSSIIVRFTQDPKQIERIMRMSKLPELRVVYNNKPGKWDNRPDYLQTRVIKSAIDKVKSGEFDIHEPSVIEVFNNKPKSKTNLWKTNNSGNKVLAKKVVDLTYEDKKEIFKELGYTNIKENSLSGETEMWGRIPTDSDLAEMRDKLREVGLKDKTMIKDIFLRIGKENEYNPIKDYLEGIVWNGEDNIGRLCKYFKDDEGLFPLFFKKWIVGAISKIYNHTENRVLVLDGAQNIGKSKFCEWIGEVAGQNLFTQAGLGYINNDTELGLVRYWIWEISELDGVAGRSSYGKLKNFLTRKYVTNRAAYKEARIHKPAISSFIGTYNNISGILSDPTGNRRFMICTLEEIQWWEYMKMDVNQIWAQAFHLFKTGYDHNLDREEIKITERRNDQYQITDPVQEAILNNFKINLENEEIYLTYAEIERYLREHAGVRGKDLHQSIPAALTKIGCKKARVSVNGTGSRVQKNVYLGISHPNGYSEGTTYNVSKNDEVLER